MNCPKCNATQFVKAGFVQDKQRFMCKACNYHFVDPAHNKKGFPQQVKRKVLEMVRGGNGIRQVARTARVSHVSILRWMREAAEETSTIGCSKQLKLQGVKSEHNA